MSLTRTVLKIAAPVPKIGSFDRYLFIGPHPDDIEIGAGATAAVLAEQGKKITFLICTDGRYGLTNAPKGTTPEELIAIRRREAQASARSLGVDDVRFLDFCDGGFYETEELERAIAGVIGEIKPQLVFAPDPDVSSECHVDHRRVGESARSVVHFAPYGAIMARLGATEADVEALAFYMTARPNRFVNTKGRVGKQFRALFDHHVSQFPAGSADAKSIALYLKLRSVDYGLRAFCGQAEGFRVLGRTQMHCLPEAGL